MNLYARGGSTPAVRAFVTVCFALWAGLSYVALFVLASVFWVAYLEAKFRPEAFVEYAGVLIFSVGNAYLALRLWRRVAEHPWHYETAAWAFGAVIVLGVIASAIVALV